MIDETLINTIIKDKKSFKLGARGIAAVCMYIKSREKWDIRIDRASCLIYADTIAAVDDEDYYMLQIVRDGKLIGELDLMAFTKITVIE